RRPAEVAPCLDEDDRLVFGFREARGELTARRAPTQNEIVDFPGHRLTHFLPPQRSGKPGMSSQPHIEKCSGESLALTNFAKLAFVMTGCGRIHSGAGTGLPSRIFSVAWTAVRHW